MKWKRWVKLDIGEVMRPGHWAGKGCRNTGLKWRGLGRDARMHYEAHK